MKMDVSALEKLRNSLMKNSPILFLGAGFSRDSICNYGEMPTGKELVDDLLSEFIIGQVTTEELSEIQTYKLRELCDCINSINGNDKTKLNKYLTMRFSDVLPNKEGFHTSILKYPWRKIYTINIDDLVENIYENGGALYTSFNKSSHPGRIAGTEIIKLHGCVRNPTDGYVFSRSEYTELISKKLDLRLNECAMDIVSNDIIFVGTSLDEPDVEYYLKTYEDAGYKASVNTVFFIEPFPTLQLKQKAGQMNAEIIQWKNIEFMQFVKDLNYDPDRLEKSKIKLNYNSIYRLEDNRKIFEDIYESSIYEGFSCKWQDVSEEWVYNNHNYLDGRRELFELLKRKDNIKCFSVYGEAFSGKSCLLKQLGYEINKEGYDVLEFKGRAFDRNVLLEYIKNSPIKKTALVIDNASYYYHDIEQILNWNIDDKELLIISASRTYYHMKKKYYLDGNCYCDFKCTDIILPYDADVIDVVLEKKGYLSHLQGDSKSNRLRSISSNRSISNLIIELTYGKGLKDRVLKEMKSIGFLNRNESRLLLEISIFDNADIEYYPRELFILKYGNLVNIDGKIDSKNLKIIDYIKYDETGISLRNSAFHRMILEENKRNIPKAITDILTYVAKLVDERNNDIWKIIFQSLVQTDILKKRFGLSMDQTNKILYGIKEYYKLNSYYWLQLGLFEQSNSQFSKALGHFNNSLSIRPNSFKIQHALARNYLRHANFENSLSIALPLFLEGEKLIKDLINSDEYYKKKAKPFSIHCLIEEKVKFINKFNYVPTNSELNYLIYLLDEIVVKEDDYVIHAAKQLYSVLKKLGKGSLLKINLDSPYLRILKEEIEGPHTSDS